MDEAVFALVKGWLLVDALMLALENYIWQLTSALISPTQQIAKGNMVSSAILVLMVDLVSVQSLPHSQICRQQS